MEEINEEIMIKITFRSISLFNSCEPGADKKNPHWKSDVEATIGGLHMRSIYYFMDLG